MAHFRDLFENEIHNLSFGEIPNDRDLKLYADRETVNSWNFSELLRMIQDHEFSPISQATEIENDSHDVIVVYGNDYLPGGSPPELKEFFDWLRPIDEIRRKIDNARHELGIDKSIVGVHARGSDFGAPVESYITQMRDERLRNPSVRFFVCSDTEDYERRILSEFPGTITHAKSAYVEREGSGNNWSTANIHRSAESVSAALIDMHLLAETEFKIYNSYSSFAHVVKMMSHGVAETFPAPGFTKESGTVSRLFKTATRRLKKLFNSP